MGDKSKSKPEPGCSDCRESKLKAEKRKEFALFVLREYMI